MRSALFVLLCLGIALPTVEARRDCASRYAAATVASPVSSFIALPAVVNVSTADAAVNVVTANPLTKILIQPRQQVVVAEAETIVVTVPPIACPSDSDPNRQWHLSYLYKNQPRCIGLQNIPANTTDPTKLREICRQKHPNAYPASFHSVDELRQANGWGMNGGVLGTYVPAGKAIAPANFVNQDGEPVDFYPYIIAQTQATAFQLVTPKYHILNFKWYIQHGNANAICALWI